MDADDFEALQGAIDAIADFIQGKGDPWAWDDFISVPASNPAVTIVQGYCRNLPEQFPPAHPSDYCNEHGMRELAALLASLRNVTSEQGFSPKLV